MKFTPELCEAICEEIAGGATINSVCRALGLDSKQIRREIAKNPTFAAQMHAARISGTDYVMDDIREFGNRELEPGKVYDAARDRVALDALKFYVGKMNPERYGDKIDLNVRGKLDMSAILLAADQRLAALPSALRLPDVRSVTTIDQEDDE